MPADRESPFGNIESAQDYIALLMEAAVDARRDIEDDLGRAGESSRRLQALRLVDYKLAQLQRQLDASRRLLNDLRSLRRLLLGERHLQPAPEPRDCGHMTASH